MAPIAWNNDFSVSNDVLDSQHKNIIKAISALIEAIYNGQTETIIPKLYKALVAYSEKHFSFEEELLRKYHYPGINAQIKAHRSFIKKLNELYAAYNKSDDAEVEVELLDFLNSWLFEHIREKDKSYSKFLTGKMISASVMRR